VLSANGYGSTPSWSAPRVELLHVLMLADLKGAERCPRPRDREMNSFWLVSSANPRPYALSPGARDAFAYRVGLASSAASFAASNPDTLRHLAAVGGPGGLVMDQVCPLNQMSPGPLHDGAAPHAATAWPAPITSIPR
jgi:hypothetical protein